MYDALADGGTFVSVRPGGPPLLRGTKSVSVMVRADADQLRELVRLVGSGTLRVADVLPLAQAAKAFERLADAGLRGRLVLTP